MNKTDITNPAEQAIADKYFGTPVGNIRLGTLSPTDWANFVAADETERQQVLAQIVAAEDSFPAQLRKKVAMQDAYLNLRPKDLIACLGDADAESRRILETCAWKGTIGYEISDIDEIEIGGGFDDESRIEYCEHIYAMLIAPFAVWLAKTGYKPDDAFFKKTLL